MYSRHSLGFFASSVFRRMLRVRWVAATPFRLHSLDKYPPHLHAHQTLPFFDQGRHSALICSRYHWPTIACRVSSFVPGRTRRIIRLCFSSIFRRGVCLNDLQQIALSPDVVAFAVEIFAGRLAFLLPQLSLLLLDPSATLKSRRRGRCRGSCARARQCAPARSADARSDGRS